MKKAVTDEQTFIEHCIHFIAFWMDSDDPKKILDRLKLLHIGGRIKGTIDGRYAVFNLNSLSESYYEWQEFSKKNRPTVFR